MLPRFCLVLAITALFSTSTFAQPTSRDMQKEAAIWDQLEAIAPGALEEFKAGTIAMDAGNYAEAVRLYEAVPKKGAHF
jgi:hypothetical protein